MPPKPAKRKASVSKSETSKIKKTKQQQEEVNDGKREEVEPAQEHANNGPKVRCCKALIIITTSTQEIEILLVLDMTGDAAGAVSAIKGKSIIATNQEEHQRNTLRFFSDYLLKKIPNLSIGIMHATPSDTCIVFNTSYVQVWCFRLITMRAKLTSTSDAK
jgi:hypothetical protein